MNGLLYLRVYSDHLLVQFRVLRHQDLRVPGGRHEYCVDATAERCGEDVADLQSDQKGESNNHRREITIRIVSRVGEGEVEIGHQRAGIAYEGCTHAEHRANETFIDKGIDSTLLDHVPCGLCCGYVCLSVQGNVGEGVAIQELNSPIQNPNQTTQDAKQDGGNNVALGGFVLSSNRADLAQEVDDGHNQTAETDAAKTVGQGSFQCAASSSPRQVVRVEIPGTIHTGNGDMDRVLQPFRNPVHGKCDEDDQTGHLCRATATAAGITRTILTRLPPSIDGDKGDTVPRGEGRSQDAAEQTDKIDMAIFLGDVDGSLQHQGAEGDARNPGDEGEYQETNKD